MRGALATQEASMNNKKHLLQSVAVIALGACTALWGPTFA
jgi:hypothetical protein